VKRSALLQRLGLDRPELRAWALYDWANSVFMTTGLNVFPIFFRTVAAAELPPHVASGHFALSTSLSVTIVALLSPVLGAIADHAGRKKALLAAFVVLGASATSALWLVDRGEWFLAACLFVVANVGASGSIVFCNSLLPHIARPDEVDRVSTAGFALGYVSGALLLAVNLLWIAKPALFGIPSDVAAMQLSFLIAGLWWALFSLPVLRRVPEPPARPGATGQGAVEVVTSRLLETMRHLRGHRDALWLLLAFLVYNDGINTIIRMATLYGTDIGIGRGALIAAILMVQVVGIPFAFLAGAVADRLGAKRTIFLALGMYVGISVLAYRMQTAADFFVIAFLVATVMGGAQALGRSLFARMVPRHKSAEMFGFFGVFDKFGGVLGSALFWLVITLTGSGRPAILALVVFFVVGAGLLTLVDVERGVRAAREAEAAAGLAGDV
jgi:UMF1 family MFS transporter